MKEKINYYRIAPELLKGMNAIDAIVKEYGFDPLLIELVKLRTSMINGCAYCVDIHAKDARKLGETEQRIYGLVNWRECDFFTEKERVALELTERVTLISQGEVDEALYQSVLEHFTQEDYVHLIYMITQMNSWNRLSRSMGNRAK